MEYKNLLGKIGLVSLLILICAAVFLNLTPAAAQNENLTIKSDTSTVTVGVSQDVNFTVTRECGTDPDDVCTLIYPPPMIRASGVNVHLEGAASGSGVTDDNGIVIIPVNSTHAGTIKAIASETGFTDGITIIKAEDGAQTQAVLNLTADTDNLFIGVSKNVTFSVNHVCGDNAGDTCSGNASLVPNLGVDITISGVASGSGKTGWDGKVTIPITASSMGNVTATAHSSGYTDGVINIPADYLPVITISPEMINNSFGENVIFTVSNVGPVNISADVLQIRNATNSKWIYSSNSLNIGTVLPGQSANTSWDQKDNMGNQVPEGLYKARLTFSYHNRSFSNSTDFWVVSGCLNDALPPITYSSEVGRDITFRTGNLSGTLKVWDVSWYLNSAAVYNETGIVNYSHYVNNNSPAGTWNVTAVASSGCNIRSWTIIWTVTNKPAQGSTSSGGGGGSSGGGGGGGGGITTAEPYTNILKFDRQDADLSRDKPSNYSFRGAEFSIYQVSVVGLENEGDVGIRIEHLKNASALVNRVPPGKTYANENLWINSKRVRYADVNFRVNNSWIEDNGLNAGDIKLLRFNDGWTKLNTKVIGSDGTYTYFSARTPGFSSFAISGLVNQSDSDPSTQGGTYTGYSPVDNYGNDVNSTNATNGDKKAPGFGIVSLIAVLFTIVYICKKRR